MKFLIAGLGSIGHRHLRNLMALGQEDILLYRTNLSKLPDEDLQKFRVLTDLQAALDLKPDAVIVSNPTALHLQIALPAAERGIHLFLEKPISHSMQNVDQLKETVERNSVKVLVGFQFRFHPGLHRIKVILNQQVIGRPLSVHAHWGEYLPGWHPWEDYRHGYSALPELGGGVILTLCHPLDYLRNILGEVESLWAFTTSHSQLDIPVEDTAEIGLRFVNGVVGTVHLDYVQRPPTHWLEIIGTEGTLRWDNASGTVKLFRAEQNEWETFPVPAGYERNHMFLEEMRHFLAMLQHNVSPVCSLEDGVRALQLALAAHQSAQHQSMILI